MIRLKKKVYWLHISRRARPKFRITFRDVQRRWSFITIARHTCAIHTEKNSISNDECKCIHVQVHVLLVRQTPLAWPRHSPPLPTTLGNETGSNTAAGHERLLPSVQTFPRGNILLFLSPSWSNATTKPLVHVITHPSHGRYLKVVIFPISSSACPLLGSTAIELRGHPRIPPLPCFHFGRMETHRIGTTESVHVLSRKSGCRGENEEQYMGRRGLQEIFLPSRKTSCDFDFPHR